MKFRVQLPQTILAEYQAGDTLDVLARRHGTNPMTIRQRLLAAGCTMRKAGRKAKGAKP